MERKVDYVILAGGRGSRVGRISSGLHKALLPIKRKAIISHLIDQAPPNSRIIIMTGYNSDQVEKYVSMAHPDTEVIFKYATGWDRPQSGPGSTLRAAYSETRPYASLVVVACDTLWNNQFFSWDLDRSWLALAPQPEATENTRWLRVQHRNGLVTALFDKTERGRATDVSTAFMHIAPEDSREFWKALISNTPGAQDEMQMTPGLAALMRLKSLHAKIIDWTDTGDEHTYKQAIQRHDGFDWAKTGEVTYVLPESGRVLKYWEKEGISSMHATRAVVLGVTPKILDHDDHWLMMEHIMGPTVYERLASSPTPEVIIPNLLRWAEQKIWSNNLPDIGHDEAVSRAYSFYFGKTMQRVMMLDGAKYHELLVPYLSKIDWMSLASEVEPVYFHGDFTMANIMAPSDNDFVAIDWRGDFVGTLWGDMRYDIAKLLSSTVIHWGNAQHGVFGEWEDGEFYYAQVMESSFGKHIPTIAALCLINSAPLHPEPFRGILVNRAIAWLEEIL